MKAVVIKGAGDIAVVDGDQQALQEGQVRVAVQRVGLCGTDFSLAQGQLGLNTFPVTPGHEVVGVVRESRSPHWAEGDPVALDPLLNCGSCEACRSGHPQWCNQVGVIGVVQEGGLQEELVLGAQHWVRIPDAVSLRDAVLLEPTHVVSTVLSTVNWESIGDLLILGTGALGLLLIRVLTYLAPHTTVWAYDPVPERLDRAVQASARRWSPQGAPAVDVVIDGVGAAASADMAAQAIRPGGHIVVYGVPKPDTAVTTAALLFRKNVQVTYSRLYSHDFSQAVAWIESGWVQASAVVSDELTLDQVPPFLREKRWLLPQRWGKAVVVVREEG